MHTNTGYTPMREKRIQSSQHARRRCAQRGIDYATLPLIKAFGESSFDGMGGIRYVMTRRALDQLISVCGLTPDIKKLHGQYIVIDAESGETIITAGHRH